MKVKQIYEVTDPAAIWFAGQRIPDDRRVELTEAEARYELLAGTIRLADGQAQKPQPQTQPQKVRN